MKQQLLNTKKKVELSRNGRGPTPVIIQISRYSKIFQIFQIFQIKHLKHPQYNGEIFRRQFSP